MRPVGFGRAAAVAIVAGLAYALAPLSALVLAGLVLLLRRATRGLDSSDRRWFAGIVASGIALRLIVLAGLIVTTTPGAVSHPSLFGDGSYAIGRSLWIRSVWLGEPIHPRYFMEAFDAYAGGGHNYIQAVLQIVVGPSPWSLHVFTGGVFVAGAVLVYRFSRACYGGAAASLALAVTLLSPTWLAWSLTPIKDTLQFTAVAVAFTGVLVMQRQGSGRARLTGGLAAALSLALLSSLRGGAGVAMGVTAVAGLIWALIARWGSAAAVAMLGIVVGAGMLVPATVLAQRATAGIEDAADRHLGHVSTPGAYYKLLDERTYHEAVSERAALTPGETTRFLFRAVAGFFAVPLPWQFESRALLLYMPVQFFWYGLVVLSIAGIPAALRAHPLLTVMLLAYVAASVAIIAPNSGNVGTLIRHRDSLVPFVTCLSGVGVTVLTGWRARLAGGSMAAQWQGGEA